MRYILKEDDSDLSQDRMQWMIVDTRFGGDRKVAILMGSEQSLMNLVQELNNLEARIQCMDDLNRRLEREANSSNMFHGGID